jgi:hypothetical protein
LGADVKFLIWLEGEADRLPRLEALRDVEGYQWAPAIRAATWLRSQSINEAWDCRYRILEFFLCNALKLSGNYTVKSVEEDLAKMQTVISMLLPESARTPYLRDILNLRKAGQPPRLPRGRPRRTGGQPESEQTQRMRAAVSHLKGVSKNVYQDLADLWNEALPGPKYDAQQILQRTKLRHDRKDHFLRSSKAAANDQRRFWHSLFLLKPDALQRAFLGGVFPWSHELSDLYAERTGKKVPWDG